MEVSQFYSLHTHLKGLTLLIDYQLQFVLVQFV